MNVRVHIRVHVCKHVCACMHVCTFCNAPQVVKLASMALPPPLNIEKLPMLMFLQRHVHVAKPTFSWQNES